MPLYELFCLARPLRRSQLAEIMRKAGVAVLDKGGVITDIKSFGEQPLAYDIRQPSGKYSEVRGRSWLVVGGGCAPPMKQHAQPGRLLHATQPRKHQCRSQIVCLRADCLRRLAIALQAAMWEMTFMVQPSALKDVEHELRVDERVLRWMFLKKRSAPVLPNTYRINKYVQANRVPKLQSPWEEMAKRQGAQQPQAGASAQHLLSNPPRTRP